MSEKIADMEQYRLDHFREQIRGLYEGERKSGLTAMFAGEEPFNVMELTAEDMSAWNAFELGFMDRGAFEAYRQSVRRAEHRPNTADEHSSRLRFVALLASRATARWLEGEQRMREGRGRTAVPRKQPPPLSEAERERLIAAKAEKILARRRKKILPRSFS